MFLRGRTMFAPTMTPSAVNSQKKKSDVLFAFSFAYAGAKEKAIKKKTPKEDFALCGARQELRVPPSRRRRHTCFAYVSIPRLRKPPQRLDLNFNGKRRAKTLMVVKSNSAKNKSVAFCKGNAFLLLLLLLLFLCVLLRAQPRFFFKNIAEMRKVIEACQAAGIIDGKSVAEIFLCFHYAALAHIFHRSATDNIRKKLAEMIFRNKHFRADALKRQILPEIFMDIPHSHICAAIIRMAARHIYRIMRENILFRYIKSSHIAHLLSKSEP